MPIVNYVREHRRFIRYASDEKLTASERLLWYALMEIFNQEAEGNVWPDDFIRISNNRLLAVLEPMGIDTMMRARNALKQHGRIDFRPGNKNKLNPAYRMVYFYPEGYTQNAGNNGFYTQNADNIQGNTGYNMPDNMGYNTGYNRQGSIGDIIINQNRGYTGTKRGFDEEDDDAAAIRAGEEPDDDPVSDRAEREAAIRAAYIRSFGWMPNRSEVNALVLAGHIAGFSPVMVAKALEIAAGEGARKPVQYTREILADWKSAHVMQPHQIDEYRVREDIRANRHGMGIYGTGDLTEDFRQAQEEREARQRENIEAGIEQEPLAKES